MLTSPFSRSASPCHRHEHRRGVADGALPIAIFALILAACAGGPGSRSDASSPVLEREAGATPPTSSAQPADAPRVGPARGALVVAGGGQLGPEIVGRFVELAGGREARIVVIPTAGTRDSFPDDWSGLEMFREAGVRHLTVLHTRDPEVADDEAFVAPLRGATGVWIPGGRQWRLADAYLGTRTLAELFALLDRGGVIGGSSAGASIQASYMVRGAPAGNHIMMAPGYEEGFGFLRGVAVDQHLLARGREDDLLEVIARHPELLGIGLDEGTAIVVHGDRAEVIGRSKAAFYNAADAGGRPYYFLETGDVFDLARRVTVESATAVAGGHAGTGGERDASLGTPCTKRPRGPGLVDPDLYCIDLVAIPELHGATGTAELGWVPSPFGTAVTVDGRHVHEVTVTAEGLPDPSSLGLHRTYVAWATTPVLSPMVKLGELQAAPGGRLTATGRVDFNKFLVLVTAEASSDVAEREGRIVLRGSSASMRLLPQDIPYLYTMRGEGEGHGHGEFMVAHGADTLADPGDGAARKAAGAADTVSSGDKASPTGPPVGEWIDPPMHPDVPMPSAMMGLRPSVSPFLPGWNVEGPVPFARPREVVPLEDGDTLRLEAGMVRRTIRGRTFVMYGFNGQYPGPLIDVPQGATIVVDFRNHIDLPTAVHWHGLRLENRFDGVPGVTQEPVEPGGRFIYEVHFPDAGIYWYHPHLREDIQQDLGLYGNMRVRSPDTEYYGPAHREEVLMLDDLMVAEQGLVPYGLEATTHALMGRFGNVMLVNGEPDYRLEAKRGEVVRLMLTNVSNTRVFNLSIDGARMKVVGSDVSRFEREEWVESVVLSPAERYVVDVRFERPGATALVNRVQSIDHLYGGFFAEADTLARIDVAEEAAVPDLGAAFERLRHHYAVSEELERFRPHFDRPVDKELVLTLEVDLDALPFPVGPMIRLDSAYFNPVEWSGTMPMMNWVSTARETRWILREPATGRENMDIEWTFDVGDVVRLRLTNDRDAAHAMQHPIHLHGQRFLILSVNDVPTDNLVWKDTMLLPVGATADLLVEMSNPGKWMLHCHIAEHMETGMMMVFEVQGERASARPSTGGVGWGKGSGERL